MQRRAVNVNEPIDLDANATTPLLPAARDIMFALGDLGNPASGHALGRRARKHLEDARERIAARLGAQPDEVVFTSGATEANNLAILGFGGRAKRVLASPMEHPSALEPVKKLAAEVEWLKASPRGAVRIDEIDSNPDFAVLQLVNHETGVIQPVAELASRMPLHCDAAQAVGKIPVRFDKLGVASLAASGHKFRGPAGIGLLLVKRGVPLPPLMSGGHQQQGRRPGTEPVALAVGMAVALDHAVDHLSEHDSKCQSLGQRFLEHLRESAAPIVLNGSSRLPYTMNISFPGCRGDLLMMALDLAGVACSPGSAFSRGSLLPSPVLQAMGVPDDLLRSAIRFSFGPELELETMDEAAARVARVVKKLRER